MECAHHAPNGYLGLLGVYTGCALCTHRAAGCTRGVHWVLTLCPGCPLGAECTRGVRWVQSVPGVFTGCGWVYPGCPLGAVCTRGIHWVRLGLPGVSAGCSLYPGYSLVAECTRGVRWVQSVPGVFTGCGCTRGVRWVQSVLTERQSGSSELGVDGGASSGDEGQECVPEAGILAAVPDLDHAAGQVIEARVVQSVLPPPLPETAPLRAPAGEQVMGVTGVLQGTGAVDVSWRIYCTLEDNGSKLKKQRRSKLFS